MPHPAEKTGRTRRLFFGLWPDQATRQAIVRATRTAVRRAGGRPVPPANYHITLAFLGNQPGEFFDEIVAAGQRVVAPPMELSLDTFHCWPKPRVFWFGPRQFPPALPRLAADLWTQMESMGLARDRRALQPHVTLARKVRVLPELAAPKPVRWPVDEFVLIESSGGDQGPKYFVVERFLPGSSPDP
jgi:2'-5' RNA ligase